MEQIAGALNRYVARLRRGDDVVDDEAGNQMIEYLLLCALIAIISMLAVSYLGDTTSSSFSSIGSSALGG